MMNFWFRLETGDSNKISVTIFKLIKVMHNNQIFSSKWCSKIVQTLNNLGLTYLWNNHDISSNKLKATVHQRISDMSLQTWSNSLWNNKLCLNYRMFKNEPKYESQFNSLENDLRISMTKFRCGTHHLPISERRYQEIGPHNMCPLGCDDVGDEYHYLLCCPALSHYRDMYIDRYYYIRPNVIKFNKLMNLKNKQKLSKVAKFTKTIMYIFRK